MLRMFALILAAVFVVSTPAWAGNVVLVSWDGTHPLVVKDMLAQGQLPTVQGLLNQGAWWHDLIITEQLPDVTVTKPGHAQMLTGFPKTITGVINNHTWTVIPLGMTLPEQWKTAGAKIGFTVQKTHLKAVINGVKGPFWNVFQIADCSHAVEANPAKAIQWGLTCLNQIKNSRFFLFVHSRNPDDAGHGSGAGSAQYRQRLHDNDAELAKLLIALPPNTQFVLTTDHGFGDGLGDCPPNMGFTHRDCPAIWAVSFPPLTLAGNRLMDLAPALRP